MTDYNLEQIVKPFVDDVHTALKGFEGKAASLESTVAELTERLRASEASAARTRLFAGATPEAKSAASHEDKAAIRDFVAKGLNGTTGPTGGFAVPEVIASDIAATALKLSPVRRVANVRRVDTPNYRMLVNVRGTGSGWVGETAARPETATPSLSSITPPLGTVYALADCTEELLGDFAVNVEEWLTDDVAEHLAEQESIAFISGDGTNKPRGFLSGTINATSDATRAFGAIQHIATGNASALGTDLPGKLLAMIFATKAGYRQADGAAWMASTAVIQALSELKDSQGRPLYIPSLREGTPGTLLGFQMVEAEHMPGIAAGAYPIAFGNWQRGYTIVDRTDIEIIRDPYTKKGSTLFYVHKRVGGAVRNSEAIKVLKVAAA